MLNLMFAKNIVKRKVLEWKPLRGVKEYDPSRKFWRICIEPSIYYVLSCSDLEFTHLVRVKVGFNSAITNYWTYYLAAFPFDKSEGFVDHNRVLEFIRKGIISLPTFFSYHWEWLLF
jgi:hypothetical protein